MGWREAAKGGIKCGEFLVRLIREHAPYPEIESVEKETGYGEGVEFEVSCGHQIRIPLSYVSFESGSRDVRVCDEIEGTQALRRLEHGLRMSVYKVPSETGVDWAELSQARINLRKPNKWSNLFKANRQQLEQGAGFDVLGFLEEHGALRTGKKQDLIGEGQRATYLCVVFPSSNLLVPVLAYVATRILPLSMEYAGPQRPLL